MSTGDLTWTVSIVALIVLGLSIQEEYGAKGNTAVRILDTGMNLVVIFWALLSFVIHRRDLQNQPLRFALLALAFKCVLNVYPLFRVIYNNATLPCSEDTVLKICEGLRDDYFVDRVSPQYRDKPVIYVANHALWCLDDIVALGALSGPDLSVVVNINPSGLGSIPVGCRTRVCTIDRTSGRYGYQALHKLVQEEVLGNGRSLIIFPEDMKKKTRVDRVAPLRTGTFKIARELHIPIVPLWIDWPCQFPSVIRSTEKVLRIHEGRGIKPETLSLEDCQRNVHSQLTSLSKRRSG